MTSENTSTVYVVIESYYDFCEIRGVFQSKEKAGYVISNLRAKASENRKSHHLFEIEEHTLE